MLNTTLLLGFIVAALVVLLTPGPGVLYVVARSLHQGIAAGLVSALGLSTGVLVHVAAAVVGLSAILMASATAFTIIKYIGAAYLVYLGLKILFASHGNEPARSLEKVKYSRLYLDGVVVSVLNPKIALFFLAFLPQFVDPAFAPIPLQIALLGLVYSALALITDSAYGLLGGALRHRLKAAFLQGPVPRFASGGVLIGLGLQSAFAEARR